MAISLRLDDRTTKKLTALAKARGISRSELIRDCLDQYLADTNGKQTAWELGKHLFGCFKSGQGDLSVRVKEITREQINARRTKNSRR